MDDLISRDAVIELVNNFNFVGYQIPNAEIREEFTKAVEKIPTAYNVDKVCEQIKKERQVVILVDRVMELIKAGGVNE